MKYVIFGPGRVGQNIAAYLQSLGHQVCLISHTEARTHENVCTAKIETADIVMAAIPDSSLADWFKAWHPFIGSKPAIHFSGAMTVEGMYGFHPLYSFPETRLSCEKFANICFVIPEGGPAFSEIFAKAHNPHFVIPNASRAHYHALAVLGGNMVGFIWNQIAKELNARYPDAPDDMLAVYFNSILDRFIESPTNSLTGPMARRDRASVEKNQAALVDTPELASLYTAFLGLAWPDYEPKP